LYGFKNSPSPSVSILAMFDPFFKYGPFPIALFVAFCATAEPTPQSAPVANIGRMVFARNGKAFAAKPASIPRMLIFHVVNNLTFAHFYCDAFSILVGFCHFVHLCIGQSKYHFHTSLQNQDECSWGFLTQLHVSNNISDFLKCLLIHLCKTCLLYVIKSPLNDN